MLLNIFSFTSVPYYFSDTLNLKKFFEFCVKLGQVHPPSHEARPQSYFEQAVPAVSFKIWFTQHLEYIAIHTACLLYTSPSPRDGLLSRMPSSA